MEQKLIYMKVLILNQKMESDKIINSFKEHLVISTQTLKDYPDGKINIVGESEYDIVDFIEADDVEYIYYDYELAGLFFKIADVTSSEKHQKPIS